MIAHCAVFLLRVRSWLKRSNGHKILTAFRRLNHDAQALEIGMPTQELADRHEKTMESIAQTADAYEGEEGGNIDGALFLRALLKSDIVGYKTGGSSLADALHTPRYRDGHNSGPSLGGGISRTPSPEPVVVRGPPEPLRPVFRQHPGFEFPAGPDIPMHPSELASDRSAADYGPHAIKFWKTMFSQYVQLCGSPAAQSHSDAFCFYLLQARVWTSTSSTRVGLVDLACFAAKRISYLYL